MTDDALQEAVGRLSRGLVDADLGGGLIKQRVARAAQGRSGGYRVLLVFRDRDRTVFVYGFARSERDNIDERELEIIRKSASAWLAADETMIERALVVGLLIEVER